MNGIKNEQTISNLHTHKKKESVQMHKVKIQVSGTSSPVNRTVPKCNYVPTCIPLWD